MTRRRNRVKFKPFAAVALAAPDVRQRMLDAGIEPAGGTPQQFAAFIQSEMVKWGKVAKTAGIQPE